MFFVSRYNKTPIYFLVILTTLQLIKSLDLCLILGTSTSAGKTWSLKSPLDGKDGEGVTMVERTAGCRYPSIPPHQGESVINHTSLLWSETLILFNSMSLTCCRLLSFIQQHENISVVLYMMWNHWTDVEEVIK